MKQKGKVRRVTFASMKRKEQYPQEMTPIDMSETTDITALFPDVHKPFYAWVSRKFLAQLYLHPTVDYPSLMRLSVNRVKYKRTGGYVEGITWDELIKVKRECGFGDWYAIEVYPQDKEIENVANIRHLWILEVPLKISFKDSV